ncbi:MAG: hypothetical protein KAR42_17415 [candidate division Zixibacteria bacterium]|nr:hypothetical protein [candidate division Zixibacteria bacterium]
MKILAVIFVVLGMTGLLYCQEPVENQQSPYEKALKLYNDLEKIVEIEFGEENFRKTDEFIKSPAFNELVILLAEEIRLNPNNAEAYLQLGNVYLWADDPHKALELFERAEAADSSDIHPKIMMKTVEANCTMGRYFEAKRVLGIAWAFYQDSETNMANYSIAQEYVNKKCRLKNVNTAFAILHEKEIKSLKDYIFFAIDEDNYLSAIDDADLAPYLALPKAITNEWMTIVVLPQSIHTPNSFSMTFESEFPKEFCYLENLSLDNMDLEDSRKTVNEHTSKFMPEITFNEYNTWYDWSRVLLTLDTGESIYAFMISEK